MNDSTAKPVSEMTSEERSEYERDVLAATERSMEHPEHGFAFRHRGSELSGSYPDTEIVIRYWDPRYGEDAERRYRIWKTLIDEITDIPEPPVRAGVLIKAWALGG